MKTLRIAVVLLALVAVAGETLAQGPFIARRSQKLVYDVLTGASASTTRTILVSTAGPTIVGKQYTTIALANTYISSQTHDTSNRWRIRCLQAADSLPATLPTYTTIDGCGQLGSDTIDATIYTEGAVDVNIIGGDDVNLTGTDDVTLTATDDVIIASTDDTTVTTTGLFALTATETATATGGTGVALTATTNNVTATAAAGNVALVATLEDISVNTGDDAILTVGDDLVANVTGLMDLNVTETAALDAAGIALNAGAAAFTYATTHAGGHVFTGEGGVHLPVAAGAIAACDGTTAGAAIWDSTNDLCVCPPNGADWIEVADGDAAATGCA